MFRDECGVFGIYGGKDPAYMTFLGLYALQHRGQESAGIAVSDGSNVILYKDEGLVSQVFDDETVKNLTGHIAIGHVRYSTMGESSLVNAQPLLVRFAKGTLALAHNGNLVNARELRAQLESKGCVFHSESDSEVIANLIARLSTNGIEDAVVECMKRLKGSYSLLIRGSLSRSLRIFSCPPIPRP